MKEDGKVEVLKGITSLLGGEATFSGAAVASKEEEAESLSPSHDVVKAEEYKLDTVSRENCKKNCSFCVCTYPFSFRFLLSFIMHYMFFLFYLLI